LNGVVGIKPTRGLIPCTGIVPACRSLDCVTVFARSLDLAQQAVAIMSGPDGTDPLATLLGTRPQPERAAQLRLAIPLPGQLEGLDPGWTEKFGEAVATFRAVNVEIGEVDIAPMLEAATLLYGGAFVAERYTAVGEHIAAREELIGQSLDPVVARIIMDGARHSAAAYFAGQERLDRLAAAARVALDGFDALLTPTTTGHPTIEQVAGDPVAINSALGKYTNFCNLLDMASLAVPAGTVSGLPFGVMLTGPAGSDGRLAEIARLLERAPVELLVVGAHLSGMPLNHELLSAGGTLVGSVATAREYQLYALDTTPAKPGLVRGGSDSIAGELWRLSAAGFARFMTGLAAPMAIGQIRLDDGREVLGFLCEPAALPGAADITSYGGWRAWLGREARALGSKS
jgi:allophanate hydrolase